MNPQAAVLPAEAAVRVLPRAVIARLALINAAVRSLRALGVAVVGITFDAPPQLRLAPVAGRSLAPFLAATGIAVWREGRRDGAPVKFGYAAYLGVHITMEIPQ